ncbi:MAG TPA: oligoendopeptidase F, partial [Solibacillus sp.]
MSTIKRSEVPVQETWNLEDLFATETDYTFAIEDLKAFVDDAATSLEGSIADVNSAIKAIEVTEKIQEKMVPIGTFANLASSVDQTNTENQMRSASFGALAATIATKLSFVTSDLLALDEAVLKEAQNVKPEYKNF